QEVGLLVEGLVADGDVHGKVGTDIERRVDVDELEATGILDLAAQRTGLQRGQNQFVVAPQMSLLVQPRVWRPRASNSSPWTRVSSRGSSMCSSVWKGNTALQTSALLPFHTSSISRLSSNSRKRYLSGSGLSAWISWVRSRFSASESRAVGCVGLLMWSLL